MKQTIFQGVGTALITPFTERGIDFDAYGRLLDYQMDNGVSALIVAGTTGEGSVLSPEEHRDLIVFTAERVQGRVPSPVPARETGLALAGRQRAPPSAPRPQGSAAPEAHRCLRPR